MTPEEYYGNAFPLLKQGEAYLKSLIETYPNACAEDELQSILYVKTRIKSPESMMGKLKKRGLMEDAHTALQSTHDAIGIRVICSFVEEVYQIARWLEKREDIQIRTIAIDFWATLEHQMKYKRNVQHEETIRKELKRCADEIASVDLSMQTIRDILQSNMWKQI